MTKDKMERVAMVLVEATMAGPRGDAQVCAKHGIALRTLQHWRKQLESNDELAQLCAKKQHAACQNWIDEVPAAMRASVKFLNRAAETGDPRDPQMVHSVAGAMKLLSEVQATWKVLDARISRASGQADGSPGQDAPRGNVTPIRRDGTNS